jgi:hypothetical protein
MQKEWNSDALANEVNSDIIRRIAERGLARAQEKLDSENVDTYQHILDELERSEEDQIQAFIKRMQRGNR